ncbi:MAG: sodium:proton antiporter, partial [Verrucomicrobiales bacterium]|nr:sodium:proton antiporter [Verrucomicrobiales bacterium]
MTLFELIAALLTVAAILGFVNAKFFKLPTTIGIMLLSLVFSLILVIVGLFAPGIELFAEKIVSQIDFEVVAG